jgi:putative salt-induced outer membrane protein
MQRIVALLAAGLLSSLPPGVWAQPEGSAQAPADTPASAVAPAAESAAPQPAPSPWWGEASLGYLGTSGNSKSQSINAKLALDYQQGRWRNALATQAVQTADEGDTTGERYLLTDKLDFTFYAQNYAFLAGEFEKDLFGGIRRRTTQTAGFGRHLLTGPGHLLDVEAGGGARQQQSQESREEERDLIGRLALDYRYKISDNSGFHQNLKMETGKDNTFSQSLSELKLAIAGNFFASIIYTLQHNSQVEPGIKHTDATTAINFSYAFGHKPG